MCRNIEIIKSFTRYKFVSLTKINKNIKISNKYKEKMKSFDLNNIKKLNYTQIIYPIKDIIFTIKIIKIKHLKKKWKRDI